MNKSYFHAKKINGQFEVKGSPDCLLGHEIPRSSGQKPDGVYAKWHWDGNTLTVENDPFGFYPLYYYCHNGEIGLSPSIWKLFEEGASREIDYKALSVFIRLGFFIGNDTPFKYIRALPPIVKFQWNKDGLVLKGQCAQTKCLQITRHDAVYRYASLFQQSMKRRLPKDNNFVIPLSGGRDSRHILLELNRLGYKPKFCVTHDHYPPRSDEDVRIAKHLCSELKIEHITLKQQVKLFKNEIRKNFITNMCTDEHAQILILADFLKGKTKLIYDGLGSDWKTFVPEQIENFKEERLKELSKILFQYWVMGEDIAQLILTPESYKRMHIDCATDHLVSELKNHVDTPHPISSFYFWNKRRREISLSPYAILSDIPCIYSPYLDFDLRTFLSSLPIHVRMDSNLHTDTIYHAYPQFAHIPFEQKHAMGIDPQACRSEFLRSLLYYLLFVRKGRSHFIKSTYIVPRLMHCLVSKNYRKSIWWIKPPLLLYLSQLEQIQNQKILTYHDC